MNATKVIEHFQAINQIPRGSGNEKAVSDYIKAWAEDHGCTVKQDEVYNLIIDKPATPGCESLPHVVLQGHMDMVCEKGPNSTHDFTKDPIEHIMDGEWLHANDTTLGADNGIAVAMAMAVIEDESVKHGPLTCLFTTSEETAMDGVLAIKKGDVTGKYLLNIDTEEEGDFVVSCAGGCQVEVEIPLLRENRDSSYTVALELTLEGMLGGHSGIEIHKQRANGNVLLARLLYTVAKQYKFQMAHFTGGTKHNAIPRNGKAILCVKADDVEAIRALIKHQVEQFRKEFATQDPDVMVAVNEVELPQHVFAKNTTEALLSYLFLAPNGVFGMSQSLPGLVETSNTIAIVREEERHLVILISLRSSSVPPMQFLTEKLVLLAQKLGVKATIVGSYPAWEYEPGSSLEEQAVAVYKEVTGETPHINAIHAGLECGLLKAVMPETQMISFGPTIINAHTPQERVNVPSVERVYNYLVALLQALR